MEQGSKTLLIILGSALLIGALVVSFHSAYRQSFLAIVRGAPAESLIWRSNRDYYPAVTLPLAATQPADTTPPSAEDRHDAE